MSKDFSSLLTMWHDVVRYLPVDATAHEPVLGALSINAIMCKYMEIVADFGFALLRIC